MKKCSFTFMASLLAVSVLSSSCIGSFGLFNAYAKWQRNMSDNKFVNAVVGFVLMPIVGGVCLVVDSLVLNSIEFWSGENPMTSDVGKTRSIMGADGLLYAVTTLRDGYEVKSPNGEVSLFKYDKKSDSWSFIQNGQTRELFRFNTDGTISTIVNGQELTVAPNQSGLYQVQMAATNGRYFALR